VEGVFRFEGTVDKFMGDEIMVIWGAPISHPDDPIRAVRAALDIHKELAEFNAARLAEHKPSIKIGIGINTGSLVAGYIGSTRAMSYSVIGDTVNTASRLCAAAQAGQILISENTVERIGDIFHLEELDMIHAKGKFNPLRVFNVRGEKTAASAHVCLPQN
jgi:adenylate cyclase